MHLLDDSSTRGFTRLELHNPNRTPPASRAGASASTPQTIPNADFFFSHLRNRYNTIMSNIYAIQLLGVLLTATGVIALTATSYVYGTPLSREERSRTGERRSNFRRVPINLEAVLSAACLLGGMGLLTWSKFNLCAFLAYWLPNLSDALMFILSCR